MPKKIIKKYLPDHHKIKSSRTVNIFGDLLHDVNLWHLNRRSARGAFALGLFNAFLPIPLQMWLSVVGAIVFKVNLPLSVALVWITNPITMPPVFYGCYLVGEMILGPTGYEFSFEPSIDWLITSLGTIGPTLLLGSLVVSTTAAIIGYFTIDILWRYSVNKDWNTRKDKRK